MKRFEPIFGLCLLAIATAPGLSEGFELNGVLDGDYAAELPAADSLHSEGFAGPWPTISMAVGSGLESGSLYIRGQLDPTSTINAARGNELRFVSISSQFYLDWGNPDHAPVHVDIDITSTGRLEAESSVQMLLSGFFASDSNGPELLATMEVWIERPNGSVALYLDWEMPVGDQHEYPDESTSAILPAGDYRMRFIVDAQAYDPDGVDLYANGYATFVFADAQFGEAECPQDLNVDGIVDGADLTILLAAWGTDQFNVDFDGSGSVGGADLSRLLGNWGSCAP